MDKIPRWWTVATIFVLIGIAGAVYWPRPAAPVVVVAPELYVVEVQTERTVIITKNGRPDTEPMETVNAFGWPYIANQPYVACMSFDREYDGLRPNRTARLWDLEACQ